MRRLRGSLTDDAWLCPFVADADRRREDTTDAFLLRFQQVCDQLLRKFLPRLANLRAAVTGPIALRDILDALERVGAIDSADWWEELNELHNALVHEYAMEPQARVVVLNRAWSAASLIADWFKQFENDAND